MEAETGHHGGSKDDLEVPCFGRAALRDAALPAAAAAAAAAGERSPAAARAPRGLPTMARSTFSAAQFSPTPSAKPAGGPQHAQQAAGTPTASSTAAGSGGASSGALTQPCSNASPRLAAAPGAAAQGEGVPSGHSCGSPGGDLILLEDDVAREAFLVQARAAAAAAAAQTAVAAAPAADAQGPQRPDAGPSSSHRAGSVVFVVSALGACSVCRMHRLLSVRCADARCADVSRWCVQDGVRPRSQLLLGRVSPTEGLAGGSDDAAPPEPVLVAQRRASGSA